MVLGTRIRKARSPARHCLQRGENIIGHSEYDPGAKDRRSWNAGRKIGAKRALKPQQVWVIRFWLDREHRLRDRAMFDLAIDSKLRGCDVVKIKIGELVSGGRVRTRAIIPQQKTGRPVQFELLEPARGSMLAWLERRGGTGSRRSHRSLRIRRTPRPLRRGVLRLDHRRHHCAQDGHSGDLNRVSRADPALSICAGRVGLEVHHRRRVTG